MSARFTAAMSGGTVPTPDQKPAAVPATPPKADIAPVVEPPKPPAPAKSDEPKPGDPKPKTPAENFRALEASRDDFKTKWESSELKIKEIEGKLATAIDPARVADLEKKLAAEEAKRTEYEGVVQRFYVEHSPQFKAAYDEKINASIQDAKDAVGAELSSKLESVLRQSPGAERDAAVEKLMEDVSAFKQGAVINAYTALKRTQREREEELGRSRENYSKIKDFEAQEAEKKRNESAKQMKETFATELQAFSQIMPEFRAIEGNEEHNKLVSEVRGQAERFMGDFGPSDRARLALWAAKGFHSARLDGIKDALISKLQQQLQALQGSNPTVGAAGGKTDDKPKGDVGSRFKDAMEGRVQVGGRQ